VGGERAGDPGQVGGQQFPRVRYVPGQDGLRATKILTHAAKLGPELAHGLVRAVRLALERRHVVTGMGGLARR
jgi:hypothetical protein